jgi:hypothetical protein
MASRLEGVPNISILSLVSDILLFRNQDEPTSLASKGNQPPMNADKRVLVQSAFISGQYFFSSAP